VAWPRDWVKLPPDALFSLRVPVEQAQKYLFQDFDGGSGYLSADGSGHGFGLKRKTSAPGHGGAEFCGRWG